MRNLIREALLLPWWVHALLLTAGFLLAGMILGITALTMVVEVDL